MALLVSMANGQRHILKGDAVPSIKNLLFDTWWNPFWWTGWWIPTDFLGVKISLKVREIESIVPVDDRDALAYINKVRVAASGLVTK